jgi:GNAT superfamily N-acetyltransferase
VQQDTTDAVDANTTNASIFGRPHRLPDGTSIRLSPLTPADRADLMTGYEHLSRRTRYLRFFSAMPHLPARILDGLLDTDEDNHVAIAARRVGPDGNTLPEIVGVARYYRGSGDEARAEPSVAVIDELHGHGLGRLLLRMITRYAREHGVTSFRAHTLAGNERIRKILRASNGSIIERDGPVVVYDVAIPPRRARLVARAERGENR